MLNVAILVVNRADPDEVAWESDCTAGVASPCIAVWGHSDRCFAGDPVQFAGAPGDSPRPVPASPCSASKGASQLLSPATKKKGYSDSDLRVLVSLDLEALY